MSEDDDEKRLEGTISEGDLESDFSGEATNEETKEEDNKEEEGENTNMDEEKDPIVEAPEESSDAPVEESAPAEEVAEESVEETEAVEASTEEPEQETEAVEASTEESEQETPKEEVEAAPAAEPSVIPVQKKKSKKGLIITLIVVAVLLIGGGVGFAVWAMIHESPEAALRDALANFWTAEDVQLTGDINSSMAGTDSVFSVAAIKSGKNISGSGTIKAEYNGQNLELNFSAAYVDSGNVYIKFDGLKKLAEEVDFAKLFENFSSANETGMDFSTLLSALVDGLVEKVDGNWYKIAPSDVKEYNSNASCYLENFGNVFSKESMSDIADIYKDNAFLEIDDKASVSDKDGAKVYTLKVNKEKSKAFGEKVGKANAFKKLTQCSTQESEDASEAPVKEGEELDGEIKVSITPWTHKLVGIQLIQKKDNNETTADLKVTYDKKSVEEPSDAKKINTLATDIEEAMSGAMTQFVTELCESMYGDYGQEYVNMCIESASQSMGSSFKISDILQQYLGGGSDIDEPVDCANGDEDNCISL